MKKEFVVPEDTFRDQARASDPSNSAWVSANAGSGKTHVLAQRVIRLLLEGTDPCRILCLTYTKAAAANMANRVFKELARWTVLEDAALSGDIEALEGERPDAAKMRLARQLFARALETPGGLKIQTIHAFCEAVLHQVPLEANIAGHFELLDGQMETALIAEARRDMLTGAAGGEQPGLSDAFATVLQLGGEAGLEALLSEIVAKRDGLRGFIAEISDGKHGFVPLFAEFGFAPEETAEAVISRAWPDAYFGSRLAAAIEAAALRAGKQTAQAFAGDLKAACAEADPSSRLDLLCKAFLTRDKGTKGWKAKSTRNIMSKGVAEHFAELPDHFDRFAALLIEISDRLALFRMLEATRAALTIADWLIARYERLKSARGFLDFNDLITRTVRLLARTDAGPWVQYKLDKGIDHILVDEAQDTSPDQWKVVRSLAEEFFAGAGARDNIHRTVFAVGDEKQSIYSFQGAEPEAFGFNGREFESRIVAASQSFERVPLKLSFRSTEDVLRAVDIVFEREEVRKGLTFYPEPIEHKAIRNAAPGYVEVWPSVEPELVEEPEDWTQAIDHAAAPAVKLAEHIAQCIHDWIRNGEVIEGRQKRLTPGDVMVLVRKRDRFIHALTRSLKNRHIPVAGADRLSLRAHIAVKDLIALGRFVLQPEDDLSLAALLRSPVFGISEETLFALAFDRGSASLFVSLKGRAAEGDAALVSVAKQLLSWRAEADFRPVFEFYAAILSRDGVRARMIARLGRQAGEVLDEFLNFCLAEERAGLLGLEAFLATLESAGPEIKREMDQTRDEVRIMTVHAAKGLEAPVVFLVDSGSAPFSPSHLPRLMAFEPRRGGWQGKGYLWRVAGDAANGLSRAIARRLAEKGEEEYRRLLYVGMTRAEDRLIVCGYHGKRGQKDGAWHALVRDALAASPDCEERRHASGAFDCHRYQVTRGGALPQPVAQEQALSSPAVFPEALRAPLPPAPVLPRPLSPSAAAALIEVGREQAPSPRSPVLDPEEKGFLAVSRGSAIHKLLQLLPGVAQAEREAAALRYLGRVGSDWTDADRFQAWESVRAVLDDQGFAPVFAEGSRAEVPVMGTVTLKGREHAISGKIDRIAVTPRGVLIIDYKTNRPPPASLSEVPDAYVAQLALYRELLLPLYPGRPVRAGLLFTEAPRLIELPEKLMMAALARLTAE
jgi:ATP-dependent helicase/nuclease subunit A